MNIKDLRTEKKLSQAAFAKSLEVSTSTISAIEAGRLKVSKKIADKVKEVYDADLGVAAADPAPAAAEPAPAAVEKTEEAPAAASKKAGKKAPAKKTEKTAPAKAEKKAPAAKKGEPKKAAKSAAADGAEKPAVKKASVQVVIQSPLGGEITPDAILAKVGAADKIYVRVDENKAYWVKGDETGSVDLW